MKNPGTKTGWYPGTVRGCQEESRQKFQPKSRVQSLKKILEHSLKKNLKRSLKENPAVLAIGIPEEIPREISGELNKGTLEIILQYLVSKRIS